MCFRSNIAPSQRNSNSHRVALISMDSMQFLTMRGPHMTTPLAVLHRVSPERATPAWAQTTTDQPATTPPPAEETGSQPTTHKSEGLPGPRAAQPEATAPARALRPDRTIIPEQAKPSSCGGPEGGRVFGPDGREVGTVEDLISRRQKKDHRRGRRSRRAFSGMGKKGSGLNWSRAKARGNADTGKEDDS